MRVCVFGAGAIGGHLAARLHKGGAAVSVVARGAQLAAIQARGLRIEAPDGVIAAPVAASADPAALGVQDAVLVCVKAPALPDVAGAIGPLLGPDTTVAFVMNGIPWWYHPASDPQAAALDPGGRLEAAAGRRRSLGGVIYSACTVTEPGVIHVEHARNRLVLGEPDGAMSIRLQALADAVAAGGMMGVASPRIRDAVWDKLVLNLATGPLGVLGQASPRDFLADPAGRKALRDVAAEAMAIAAASGCPVTLDVELMLERVAKSAHRSSIVQDLMLGRPMEVAALYDAPLAMARAAGVATPVLDLLVSLVRVRAAQAGLYSGPGPSPPSA